MRSKNGIIAGPIQETMKTRIIAIQKSRIIKITLLLFVLLILNTGSLFARRKKSQGKTSPTKGWLNFRFCG